MASHDLKLAAGQALVLTDHLSSFLLPITPAYTTRYATGTGRSKPKNVDIPAGVFKPSPQTLPSGWLAFVQPEGQVYFEGGATVRVLTDAYMYNPATQAKVLRFVAIAVKLIEAKNIVLPDSAELYLMPSEDEDACYYYLADHASHTLFWLQAVNSETLYIPDVVSESNLRYALEDLYWQHIEQFPSHRFDRLYLATDELIMAYVHGEADQRTSTGSTFPYGAEDCKNFIRLLQHAQEKPAAGESVFIIARLWSNLVRQRQQTHFAQERPRLDRLQRIVDVPGNTGRSLLFSVASRLLLGVPGAYAKQLEQAWSDNIVYVYVWHDLLTKSQEDWKQQLTCSFGMATINLLFLLVPGSSTILTALSLGCCAITALASLALLNRHANTSVRSCDDAVPFLAEACADAHRRTALAFSAPRAFFLYAVGLAAAQALLWLESATSLCVFGALVLLTVLASLPWRRWAGALARLSPRCGRTRKSDSGTDSSPPPYTAIGSICAADEKV